MVPEATIPGKILDTNSASALGSPRITEKQRHGPSRGPEEASLMGSSLRCGGEDSPEVLFSAERFPQSNPDEANT